VDILEHPNPTAESEKNMRKKKRGLKVDEAGLLINRNNAKSSLIVQQEPTFLPWFRKQESWSLEERKLPVHLGFEEGVIRKQEEMALKGRRRHA